MTTVHREDHPGGVRLLSLDRPPANAIDESLCLDLTAALAAVRADDAVRAVVLTGAGRFFSAGFDFFAPRRDAAAALRMQEVYRDAHLALLALPKPTVAMVNGHAIAGGTVLALACDHRVAVDADFKIGLNEVTVGASFPRVAMEIVRLRLTHAAASELVLGAELHAAAQGRRLGVFDEILPADGFADNVLQLAARLAALPREAYAHAKAALIDDTLRRVRSETPAEAAATAAVWTAAESRAARAAQRRRLGKG